MLKDWLRKGRKIRCTLWDSFTTHARSQLLPLARLQRDCKLKARLTCLSSQDVDYDDAEWNGDLPIKRSSRTTRLGSFVLWISRVGRLTKQLLHELLLLHPQLVRQHCLIVVVYSCICTSIEQIVRNIVL